MDLILIRHAKAFERDPARWPNDALRPLTDAGRDEFDVLAKRLGRAVPEVVLVESSGFERAWETARLLAKRAHWPRPRRAERLEPLGEAGPARDPADGLGLPPAARSPIARNALPADLAALVRSAEAMRSLRAVAWVGHEPQLSEFLSVLLTGSPTGASVEFRKGAAAAVRIPPDGGAAGRSTLLWMLEPELVRRMRRGSGKDLT
ncbi:MAG: hypothetical protein GC172_11455 [Phycisphaera sp.]|nr:hypothetical protein [Phycisphaera sp.]